MADVAIKATITGENRAREEWSFPEFTFDWRVAVAEQYVHEARWVAQA